MKNYELGEPDTMLLCPKCKKAILFERVPRSILIKGLLFFLPLRRYKCYGCNKKPYIFYK